MMALLTDPVFVPGMILAAVALLQWVAKKRDRKRNKNDRWN